MSAQHDLSPRESETAELAALGLSCREIGERLYVSLGTVKTHLAHVYAKLGVKNRAQLAQFLFNSRENHPNG